MSGGKCPFTLRDSTVEKFKIFLDNYPEFAYLVPRQHGLTVGDRKRVLKTSQAE